MHLNTSLEQHRYRRGTEEIHSLLRAVFRVRVQRIIFSNIWKCGSRCSCSLLVTSSRVFISYRGVVNYRDRSTDFREKIGARKTRPLGSPSDCTTNVSVVVVLAITIGMHIFIAALRYRTTASIIPDESIRGSPRAPKTKLLPAIERERSRNQTLWAHLKATLQRNGATTALLAIYAAAASSTGLLLTNTVINASLTRTPCLATNDLPSWWTTTGTTARSDNRERNKNIYLSRSNVIV